MLVTKVSGFYQTQVHLKFICFSGSRYKCLRQLTNQITADELNLLFGLRIATPQIILDTNKKMQTALLSGLFRRKDTLAHLRAEPYKVPQKKHPRRQRQRGCSKKAVLSKKTVHC